MSSPDTRVSSAVVTLIESLRVLAGPQRTIV